VSSTLRFVRWSGASVPPECLRGIARAEGSRPRISAANGPACSSCCGDVPAQHACPAPRRTRPVCGSTQEHLSFVGRAKARRMAANTWPMVSASRIAIRRSSTALRIVNMLSKLGHTAWGRHARESEPTPRRCAGSCVSGARPSRWSYAGARRCALGPARADAPPEVGRLATRFRPGAGYSPEISQSAKSSGSQTVVASVSPAIGQAIMLRRDAAHGQHPRRIRRGPSCRAGWESRMSKKSRVRSMAPRRRSASKRAPTGPEK